MCVCAEEGGGGVAIFLQATFTPPEPNPVSPAQWEQTLALTPRTRAALYGGGSDGVRRRLRGMHAPVRAATKVRLSRPLCLCVCVRARERAYVLCVTTCAAISLCCGSPARSFPSPTCTHTHTHTTQRCPLRLIPRHPAPPGTPPLSARPPASRQGGPAVGDDDLAWIRVAALLEHFAARLAARPQTWLDRVSGAGPRAMLALEAL